MSRTILKKEEAIPLPAKASGLLAPNL